MLIKCLAATQVLSMTGRESCPPFPTSQAQAKLVRQNRMVHHEQIQKLPGMEVDGVEESGVDLRELLAVLQRDDKREVAEANREIPSVIQSIGGDKDRYRQGRQTASKAVASEIYSPPRFTAAIQLLPELRLVPGVRPGSHHCR